MKRMWIVLVVCWMFWFIPSIASAKQIEEIQTNSGELYYGKTLKDLKGKVLFRTVEGQTITIPFNKIKSIKKKHAGKRFGKRSWISLGIGAGVGLALAITGYMLFESSNHPDYTCCHPPTERRIKQNMGLAIVGSGALPLLVGGVLFFVLRDKVSYKSTGTITAPKKTSSQSQKTTPITQVNESRHIMLFSLK